MALKTLSPFLTPLSLPYRKLPQLRTKTCLIRCCEFSPPRKSRSEGTGVAAPSPGEKFLQRQQSFEAGKLIVKENKKTKKKPKPLKVSNTVASCYGCGAPLQISDSDSPGYVDPETYELKKKHHQLRTVLCRRCRLLSHGEMITAVGGHGGYSGGKQFVTAEGLRHKLSHLRLAKALLVKLVDIVDFNGSFLSRVRDLAGANPIILVITKVDLLPIGTDFNCIGDWVVEAITRKKLNVLSVHLTSSKSLVGITGVISEIQKEKKAGIVESLDVLVKEFVAAGDEEKKAVFTLLEEEVEKLKGYSSKTKSH